jgi:hypothetical protein
MQVGFNVNESLLTDYGTQRYYIDLMKMARGYRTFNGAAVDANGYPKFTTPGDNLSRIEYQTAHFSGGLPEPYHGRFRLITDGAGHIQIERKDRKGGTISTVFNGPVSGADVSPITIPASAIANNLRVTVTHITQPFTQFAIVHESHKQAWNGGQTFTPEMINLWQQGSGIVRFMKLNRADDNPADVLRATEANLYWTGNASERYAIPYEPIFRDCGANGLTPWLCIHANATDAEIAALALLIKKYGIRVFVEFGNEPFHAPRGGSPFSYWEAQAKAKWPTTAGSGAPAGRQWLAWRYSQIIDMLTQAGVRGLVRTVYADQGNWSGWLRQTFDAPAWAATAGADGESDRFNRWTSGSMVDVFAFNNYYGEDMLPKGSKPGIMDIADVGDPALVLAAARISIARRAASIGSTRADVIARFSGQSFMFAAYEGGMSDTRGNFGQFYQTPEAEVAHGDWLVKAETIAHLNACIHYADVDPSRWHLLNHAGQTLADTARGRAVAAHMLGAPIPKPTPRPIPTLPPPPFAPTPEPPQPEPEPTPEPPAPEPETPPVDDKAAIVAELRALADRVAAL